MYPKDPEQANEWVMCTHGEIVWAIGQGPGIAPLYSSDGNLGSCDGELGFGHGDQSLSDGDMDLGDGDLGPDLNLGPHRDMTALKRSRPKYAASTTNCGCSIDCKEIVGVLL
jgi:hypothetical protein